MLQVSYRLSSNAMYGKVGIVIGYAFTLFIALMVYFSLQSKQKKD